MDVTFQDLFDVKEIQEIQDAFAEATGVASIITDPAGVPITEPSRFSHLCLNIIRKSEKGRINCQYSDRVLGKMNPGGPIAQPCLSGGLWDGGTSIQLGDVHLANWLVGQVLEEDFDEDKMLVYAREIGVDEQEFKAALKNVTRMPRDQFLRICNALFLIARLLSRLALQNTQQARHIAARERAEEALRGMVKQKETLMQELQHRVKNNLGIISSLLSLEKPRLTDNQAYQVFTNAENRIRAMSRIYEQLYRSDTLTRIDLNTYIADLVQGLVDSYSPDRERIRLSLQVDALPMDLKRAVPLGLILNEVMTNAVKYAYPGDAQGEIRIGMSKADATITLTVSDDGVGLPADFDIKKTESLGLQLVKMLTDQIDGTLTIVGGKGTTIAVSFPS
jgi:two-component sensor histidine kinase/ligand-binding sensor protein